MNTRLPPNLTSPVKIATVAFMLLGVCTFVPTVTFADPGRPGEVTERGTVSLADLDVLTPQGVRIANFRIQRMAQYLCLQIVNMDGRDVGACVGKAVADAQQKLNAVIQARLAERDSRAVALTTKH